MYGSITSKPYQMRSDKNLCVESDKKWTSGRDVAIISYSKFLGYKLVEFGA